MIRRDAIKRVVSLTFRIIAGLIIILFCMFCNLHTLGRLMSHNPSAKTRNDIVRQILNGNIKPDSSGVVVLPPNLRYGFPSNKVYVTYAPQAAVLVYIPVMEARFGTSGLIYISREIKPSDIQETHDGVQCIGILSPYSDLKRDPSPERPLSRKIDRNWWFSEYYARNS